MVSGVEYKYTEVIFDTIDSNYEKKKKKKELFKRSISGHFIFLKQSLIDERFAIPISSVPITPNSDSNQFDFSYLTKLLSTFKVRPRLDVFHSQLSGEKVPGWS